MNPLPYIAALIAGAWLGYQVGQQSIVRQLTEVVQAMDETMPEQADHVMRQRRAAPLQ